jgi:hypothetical protein
LSSLLVVWSSSHLVVVRDEVGELGANVTILKYFRRFFYYFTISVLLFIK